MILFCCAYTSIIKEMQKYFISLSLSAMIHRKRRSSGLRRRKQLTRMSPSPVRVALLGLRPHRLLLLRDTAEEDKLILLQLLLPADSNSTTTTTIQTTTTTTITTVSTTNTTTTARRRAATHQTIRRHSSQLVWCTGCPSWRSTWPIRTITTSTTCGTASR